MKEFIKSTLFVIIGLIIMVGTFMLASLQQSYRYCKPSKEEVAQMSLIERWIYQPFKEEYGE